VRFPYRVNSDKRLIIPFENNRFFLSESVKPYGTHASSFIEYAAFVFHLSGFLMNEASDD
jgi:hypothetical protein